MLRTIVKGMHEVGLGVTVEGVETAAQAAVVQELACFGQGFYFSRPLLQARGGDAGNFLYHVGGRPDRPEAGGRELGSAGSR